ncbi:MAG TPA: hypothetical protein VJ787_03210 [Thermoleophilia bacterium]|nr:hypothetical protein [Thermoleophilia bacterium]
MLDDAGELFWCGELPSMRDGATTFLRGFDHARVDGDRPALALGERHRPTSRYGRAVA